MFTNSVAGVLQGFAKLITKLAQIEQTSVKRMTEAQEVSRAAAAEADHARQVAARLRKIVA